MTSPETGGSTTEVTQADVTGVSPFAPPPVPGVTMAPPRELDRAAQQTWDQVVALTAQKKEIDERLVELKGQLRMHLGRGEFSVGGSKVFAISANMRWNEEQARKVLPPQVVKELETVVLDTVKARQTLSPTWYKLCQVPVGDDRVAPVSPRSS